MLLAIDIGNTNITFCIFEDNVILEEFRVASDRKLSQSECDKVIATLFKERKVTECVIGSVVDGLGEPFKIAVDNFFGINTILLDENSKTGVTVKIDNPKEMGIDRIANACAAYMLYPKPVIVVDFGTANTFDVITEEGEHIGGLISLGLGMQLKALHEYTSKLPQIELIMSDKAIGTNTHDAILSGVVRGTAAMIDGMVEQTEKELGKKATVVATGGFSGLIRSYLKRPFETINPTLTIEGLRYLHYLNKQK